jgi:transcriptional regulator with XRE-family HTH domain
MDGGENPGIGRKELGQRVRDVRHQRGMTLRELDRLAGLSATHISEIERGKTSPTIGALIRIAAALGCEVAYFVEPEALPEVSITRAVDRLSRDFGPARMQVQTSGIPGGRLQAVSIRLDGDRKPLVFDRGEGSLGALVLWGSIRLETGAGTQDLEAGDSIHVPLDQPVQIASIGGTAEIFAVTTAPLKSTDTGTL